VIDEEEKKGFIANYFSELFRTSVEGSGEHLQQLLAMVRPTIIVEMNTMLTTEFTTEEIKGALDAIGDLKAPRPDGMTAVFFKKYWDVVGEQLTKQVMHVLRGVVCTKAGMT
jgi:hypothetical protein